MVDSAIKNEEDKKEFFDSPEEVEEKIEILASWIREASHFIALSGAGISTSAGIQDFRSGYNTVIKTGPGAWEKKSEGKTTKKHINVPMVQAWPTKTHMAFVKLIETGLLKHLISQNIDGLHRRSGISYNKISELHGNSNIEICENCKKEYLRDFNVRTATENHEHLTGKRCDNHDCNGPLKDNIINFHENLSQDVYDCAFQHEAEADLCLAIGSSLRVTPANDIPRFITKHGKLVVVNLQKTPLDDLAALRIFAFCDTVMVKLMEKLGLEIPKFKLIRRLKVSKCREIVNKRMKECFYFQGVDENDNPYSLYPKIEVKKGIGVSEIKKEPLKYFQDRLIGVYKVKVHFQGHYGESPVEITLNSNTFNENSAKLFIMTYDPSLKVWESITEN